MTNEEKFVNELIGYIFAYPDDDYMTMECLCRKLHKYGLIEKKDGEWTTDFIYRKTESNSENPNNCEHITEDGVTCAKYPACDDCLDNPLNKVKGSKRLVKGKDEPTISKMEQVDEPQTDIHGITDCDFCKHGSEEWDSEACDGCCNANNHFEPKDEPQTDCAWNNG